jgi:hypothetical protein
VRIVKAHAQTEEVEFVQPQIPSRAKLPKHREFVALVIMIIVVSAAAGLSSCAGYTSAAGTTSGTLASSPGTTDFGNVDVGSSTTQTVTFTNTGTGQIDVTSASVSGAGFSLVAANLPATLTAGQSIGVQVQFAPQSPGSSSGTLTLNTTLTSNVSTTTVTSEAKGSNGVFHTSLQGTGTQAGIAISPTSLSFNTTVGQTDVQTVTITNNGTSTLHLKSDTVSGADFATSGLSLPTAVSVGQSISFTVQFTPTSTSTVSGSIAFTDNAPASPQALSLTGDGTTAALSLGASPTSLDFGNVQAGNNNSLTTAVTNNGNSDVTISSVTVTGTGYSASGVTSGLIISPSQTVTLTITFAPTALGSASGSVSIASNATNSPTTISLSGESHTVLLSWTASTSSGVTGYYIYRATSSGSYTKLNSSSPVSTTQYTDTTVQAATSYSYEVAAVDSSGVESSPSSPTTVNVP